MNLSSLIFSSNNSMSKNYSDIAPKSPYDDDYLSHEVDSSNQSLNNNFEREKYVVDNYQPDQPDQSEQPDYDEKNISNIFTVNYVDLQRYVGLWYEIARLPVPYENNPVNVTAFYSLNNDGTIKIVNSEIIDGREISLSGVGVPIDETNSKLKIDFGNGRTGYYMIVQLGKNYDFSVVSSLNKNYLWILSRTKTISYELSDFLVNWMEKNGYEIENLVITPQF